MKTTLETSELQTTLETSVLQTTLETSEELQSFSKNSTTKSASAFTPYRCMYSNQPRLFLSSLDL